jgi:hypothetical protein
MKRVLIAKEWVGMRSFVWLLAALAIVSLADIAAGTLYALHRHHTLYEGGHWAVQGMLVLVLAFTLGAGLLARELEDGTLAFLDGLPLRRRDVFLAKLAVAGGCLFLFAIVEPVAGWLLHLALRHSVDEPVAAATLGALALRNVVLVGMGLGLGLLFGFVRNLAWALFAMACALVMVLRSAWPRAAAAIDPTGLVADGWATQGFGEETAWTVLGLALACLALAYGLFAHAGGATMARLARIAERRGVVPIAYAGAIVLLCVAAYAERDAPGADTDGASGAHGRDAVVVDRPAARRAPRKIATAHYVFNVPAGMAIEERDLMAADRAFDSALKALSITMRGGEPIDVDLAGSVANTDGLAAHDRIRINVHPGWENTLVHETVHVVAERLAGEAHRGELYRMRVFNEGLARWAEPERRASAQRRGAEDLAVATVFRRRQLGQDNLLDADALARDLDWELAYPLGARLVDALVARYGGDAPVRVLLALNQAAFPRDLNGYELYRSAFQLAGFDLNLVLNDYALGLRRLDAAYGPVIDALPRPRGLLVRDDGRVGIAVQLDRQAASDEQFRVRFRPRDDSGRHELVVVRRLDRRGARLVAWAPPAQVANDKICYQIGVATDFAVVYEPWSCLPLRVAARVGMSGTRRVAPY